MSLSIQEKIYYIIKNINKKNNEKWLKYNTFMINSLEEDIRRWIKKAFRNETNNLNFTSGNLRLLTFKLKNKALKLYKSTSYDNINKLFGNYLELTDEKVQEINQLIQVNSNLTVELIKLSNLFAYDTKMCEIYETSINYKEEIADEYFNETLKEVIHEFL